MKMGIVSNIKKSFAQNKQEKLVFTTYFKILECCVEKYQVPNSEIAEYAGLPSGDNNSIHNLNNAKLIFRENFNNSLYSITPDGMSAYLNILAQKRAAKQARNAIYIAAISVVVAICAMLLSIYN